MSGARFCPGCHRRFGGSELTETFEGKLWHPSCLAAAVQERVRVYDPKIRIIKIANLGNRLIEILRELAEKAKAEQERFNEVIQTCVRFICETVNRPHALPVQFQELAKEAS